MAKELEAGELELRQAFEETTTRNVKAILDHGNETRKLIRTLEEKVLQLEKQLQLQNDTIANFKLLLTQVQMKLYSGGTAN